MEKKNYCGLDILKFICSLFVVILHLATYAFNNLAVDGAPPTGGDNPLFLFALPVAYAVLRIAVPIFFISSSFFLFKKMKEHPDESKAILKKYCLRILKLYLFWFIIFLPVMIDKYLVVPISAGVAVGDAIFRLAWQIVLYAGFDGAWYLGASILSAVFVYLLSKKLSNGKILCIAIVLYVLASLSGTYCNLFKGTFIYDVFSFFNSTIPLYHTFFNGMLFFIIGKMMAEKTMLFSKKLNTAFLIIMPLVAYGELVLTNYFALNFATDCFLALPMVATPIFQAVENDHLKERKIYLVLRSSSTFTYFFHFLFLYVLYSCASTFGWTVFYSNILVIIATYVVIVATSILLSQCIRLASKKVKFLKYAL